MRCSMNWRAGCSFLPAMADKKAADTPAGDARAHAAHALALRRFRQLTPPLAAKSVEDTAFYRYGPLLSRNEVGSFPDRRRPARRFPRGHAAARARHAPRAMLATATHDHKRGEDARARLAVLSELPELWSRTLRGWLADHAQLCTRISRPGLEALQAPSPADRIMLYQTLVGAWPPGLPPPMARLWPHSRSAWRAGSKKPCAKPSCTAAGCCPRRPTKTPAAAT
jgi:(1->4)-alpha-D-glucan 1-alpha-D-glucosylmutase